MRSTDINSQHALQHAQQLCASTSILLLHVSWPKFVGWHIQLTLTDLLVSDRDQICLTVSQFETLSPSFRLGFPNIGRPIHKNVRKRSQKVRKRDHVCNCLYMIVHADMLFDCSSSSSKLCIFEVNCSPRKLFEEAALETFVGVRALFSAGSCTSTGTCPSHPGDRHLMLICHPWCKIKATNHNQPIQRKAFITIKEDC